MEEEINFLEIVKNLNERIEEKFDFKNFYFYFNYSTDGYHHSIMFNDNLVLWSFENDSREYFEETDSYEDLEEYVWKEFVKYVQELNKLI